MSAPEGEAPVASERPGHAAAPAATPDLPTPTPAPSMTRDNLLFVVIGLLAGFIGGYFTHEVVAQRQPAPLGAPTAAAAPEGAPAGPAAGAPAGAPAMEEIARLRAHVDANPEDADAVLLLANLNYDIRSWQKARDLYEQYLSLRPGDPDVLTDLGVALRALGDHRAALARFDEAQGLAPDHWQSLFNEIVVLALDLGQLDEAQPILGRLQELQPDNPDVARLAEEVARRRAAA